MPGSISTTAPIRLPAAWAAADSASAPALESTTTSSSGTRSASAASRAGAEGPITGEVTSRLVSPGVSARASASPVFANAEADSPRRQLAGRDGLGFMGLGMGAQGEAGSGRGLGHGRQIMLEGREIEHQRRRRQQFASAGNADQGGIGMHGPAYSRRHFGGTVQFLVEDHHILQLAVGGPGIARHTAHFGPAHGTVELFRLVAGPCVEGQERAAGFDRRRLRRDHQALADTMAAHLQGDDKHGNLGPVALVRFGHQIDENGTDQPVRLFGDHQDAAAIGDTAGHFGPEGDGIAEIRAAP